jgi:hypothetical protein
MGWYGIDLHTDTKFISAVFGQALIRTCKNFPYFSRLLSIFDLDFKMTELGTGNERWIRMDYT